MSATEVGRIAALLRYPVKSMAAESLDEVKVSWDGFVGDRRWAFIRPGLERSNFPWLTIREQARMWHYQPWFVEPDRPDASRTMVRTPSDAELDVVDPALAEELSPGARVIKQNRGVFDTAPLSLLSTQSIASLSEMVGVELIARRFRPNLLVELDGGGPFLEDRWVGAELRIGSMSMRVDRRDQRCVMINVDPVSTERNASILKKVAQERDTCMGVYGTVVTPGRVAVGDPVLLRG